MPATRTAILQTLQRRLSIRQLGVILLLCGLLTACSSPWLGTGRLGTGLLGTGLADSVEYQTISPSRDGIGRVYLGREIAKTMGHEGAAWLDRPSRVLQERPQSAVDQLDLKPTDVVADIGAGTGYFATRMAKRVPQGRVLAVDVQPEMLDLLQAKLDALAIDNIDPVLGSVDNPNLPANSLDLALMVDAYHEFAYPREMMTGIVAALKPGGRVVLAEYRAENPMVMIKRLHKMSEAQVKREMAAVGLRWLKTDDDLPEQHLLFFEKPMAEQSGVEPSGVEPPMSEKQMLEPPNAESPDLEKPDLEKPENPA